MSLNGPISNATDCRMRPQDTAILRRRTELYCEATACARQGLISSCVACHAARLLGHELADFPELRVAQAATVEAEGAGEGAGGFAG